VGIDPQPEQLFQGRSFAGAIMGRSEPRHRPYAVSGCYVQPEGFAAPRKAVTPFMVTERWGYVPVGARGQPELYDLLVDPLAQEDLARENLPELPGLHDLFTQHLDEHGAGEAFLSLWQDVLENGASGGAWAIDYPGQTI
jgi:hypothetical protein